MKMMIALRWTSTPTTPMMNRAAVRASDSASTDRSPAAEDHSAGNGDEQQYARQLESKQVITEQRRGDRSDRVELLQLLLVVIARNNQLLRKLCPQDDHHL